MIGLPAAKYSLVICLPRTQAIAAQSNPCVHKKVTCKWFQIVPNMVNKCLEFIVAQRWLFAIFLLPISFIYDIYWYLTCKWILFKGSAPGKHQERVEFVQKQVLDWPKYGNGRKMCTARPTWMSITQQKITYKDTSYKVQVNIFKNVFLSIFKKESDRKSI